MVDPAIDAFAKLLADGVDRADAYRKSGIGSVIIGGVIAAARDPRVVRRVSELQAAPSPAAEPEEEDEPITPGPVSKDEIVAMLKRDRAMARKTGQASAAVRAAELMGKLEGYFVEKTSATVDIRHMIAVRLDEAIKRMEPGTVLSLPAPGESK